MFPSIGDCGVTQTTSVNTTINSNVNLSATVSTALNTTATNNVSTSTINTATFNYGKIADCCPNCSDAVMETYIEAMADHPACDDIVITQSAQASVQVYSELDSSTFDIMKTKLTSQISTIIDDEIKQMTQEDINIIANILSENNKKTDVANNVKSSVTEAINQSFTQNLINSIIINTLSENNTTLSICYPLASDECTIDQRNTQHVQVTNVLNAVANIVQSSDAISKLSTAIKTGALQEDKGILGGLADLLKQLGPILVGAIVAGILLVIILIIVLIIVKRGKKKVVMTPRIQE